MKMFRKQEGFTLIELMVVVLIIGILVAIAIPVFAAARNNARIRACQANMRTCDGAARTFEAEHGTLPTTLAEMVTGGYLKESPTCPSGAAYTWDATAGELSCADPLHVRY